MAAFSLSCGTGGFHCIMWDLSVWSTDLIVLSYMGSQFPHQRWTHIPCIARRILNHWTTREVSVQTLDSAILTGASWYLTEFFFFQDFFFLTWTILKFFIEFVTTLLPLHVFVFLASRHVEQLVPWPGIEPIPPALEGEVSLIVVLVFFSLMISDVEHHCILSCDLCVFFRKNVYLGSFTKI